MMSTAVVMVCAWIVDAIFGDPEGWPHPVRWIGRMISWAERTARARCKDKKMAGIYIGIALPVTVYVAAAAGIAVLGAVHPIAGYIASIAGVYYSLSTRCLAEEAHAILKRLRQCDVPGARQRLSRIVGRDTECLEEQDIIRATVESVSENTVDGVIAPLFYAALGGAPLALAYKAVNTLDSMIGYKNERYREIGWFSARLDDVANFIPARLSLLIIPLATLLLKPSRAIRALRIGIRDGHRSPSPNAGNPEACFAGALGIQLGGPSTYGGIRHDKPLLGDAERQIEPDDIARAVRLLWLTSLCFLAVCVMACL